MQRYACVRRFSVEIAALVADHIVLKIIYLNICSASFLRISVQVQPHIIAFVVVAVVDFFRFSRYIRWHVKNGVQIHSNAFSAYVEIILTQLTQSR